jgi:putative DNA primase/helicase
VLDYIPLTDDVQELWSYIWTLNDKKSFWFQLNEEGRESARQYIEQKKTETDIYIPVSLFEEQGSSSTRGKASQSAGIYGLWLDIDVQCVMRSRADLPQTIEDALKIIEPGPFQPSIIIHSGYGLQAWWLFNEPWIFESPEDRLEASKLAGAWNEWYRVRALNYGWGLDSVSDLARVMRVPDTFNRKGDFEVPVSVYRDSNIFYEPSDLSDFIPQEAWEVKRGTSDPSISVNITINEDAKLPKQFISMCANIDSFSKTWTHKKIINDRSNSGYDLAIASYAAQANLSDQEICDLLICHAREQGFPPKRQEYYERTIAKARQGGQLGLNPEETHTRESIFPKLKDLNTAGKDVVYAERNSVFSLLSVLLGIQIYDFVVYKTDPREYELYTENGKVFFHKGQEDLASSNSFRKRVGDITRLYTPRFKTEQWDIILQSLSFAAREIEIGTDLSEAAQTRTWVDSYINSHPAMPEEHIYEAVQARKPFKKKGNIYFWVNDLHSWLHARGEKIHLQRLGARLQRVGVKSKRVNYKNGLGMRTNCRVWEIQPPKPKPEEKSDEEGDEENAGDEE